MDSIMTLGTSVRFLTILLVLGNGIFTTYSELTSADAKVGVVRQHSVIHKRSMPVEIPPNDENTNSTEPLAAASVGERNANNSDSTTVHEEKSKETSTSTEVAASSVNISKANMNTAASTEKPNLKADGKDSASTTLKETPNASSTSTTTEKVNVADNSKTVDSKGTNSSNTVVVPPLEKNTPVNSEGVEIKMLETNNSTAALEQEDMMHSHVTPHDDDDVPDAPNSNSDSTADDSKNMQGVNSTDINVLPPVVFPNNSNVKSIENASPDVIAKLNRTLFYDVKTTEEEMSTKALDVKDKEESVTTKPVNGTIDVKTNAKSLQVVQTEDNKKLTKSLDVKTKKNMSSGIIALLTTITFAVIVVIAYVTMIMWRRYLERKYGRRELLVNELEFDTNDLRHFEL